MRTHLTRVAAEEESPNYLVDLIKSRSERTDRSHMNVHLIDGTYELFRHFLAVPAAPDVKG